MAQQNTPSKRLLIGKITGVFGVQGWLKVISYTEPSTNILRYNPWQISLAGKWQEITIINSRVHGKGLVIQIQDYTDRDEARIFTGAEIAIDRDQLPALPSDEYYWADLEGMQVINSAGEVLGTVEQLIATGSNDVLIVQGKRRHLIPYLLQQVILAIELENKIIRVDWDANF